MQAVGRQTTVLSAFASRSLGSSAYNGGLYDEIVEMREKYMSASLGTFTAYDEPLVLSKGEGAHMWDIQGNKYIDLLGQNLCISVGHKHPKVTAAAIEQMNELPHCTTMYYQEQPSRLAKELVERLPAHPSGEDWVVHFVCSGSEAVDLAAQMARAYTNNQQLLTLYKAYHGMQGMAAGLTSIGKKAEQKHFSNAFPGVHRVRANQIEDLENFYEYGSAGNIAAFIAEPLQGYGGIFPLEKGYLQKAFDLVREQGGVAIADEVQTGFCRTGQTYWGFENPNNAAIPDIITIAKGLGNGIGIIGAVVAKRSIGEAFSTRMWFNTYGSNPVAAAAGRAVLEVIDEENMLENCRIQGEGFTNQLGALCEKYPQVLHEVRGSGLFQGLQITGKDKPASQEHALEMHRRILKRGVVLGRGSAAGNVFRVQPPMCISTEDTKYVCETVGEVAKEYVKEKNL